MARIVLGGALKELRLHLCQTSPSSEGARQFVMKHYVPLKQANPEFPILIRECQGVEPRIWARYEKGAERSVSVNNLPEKDVVEALKKLVNMK